MLGSACFFGRSSEGAGLQAWLASLASPAWLIPLCRTPELFLGCLQLVLRDGLHAASRLGG